MFCNYRLTPCAILFAVKYLTLNCFDDCSQVIPFVLISNDEIELF